jgi:hypothetical protein
LQSRRVTEETSQFDIITYHHIMSK